MSRVNFPRRINFIGDIFCDILAKDVPKLPIWGSDSLASSIQLKPGGSCLNSIVHAATYAKLCLKLSPQHINLSIFSAVGFNDSQGELCFNYLNKFSPMLTNYSIKKENSISGSCIVISGMNDRCFITDRGCIAELSMSWFNRETLLNCNHLHLSGYYNCTHLVANSQEIIALFQEARNHGIVTSINPQYDATEKWDHIQELCPHLTFLFCNENELLNITKLNRVHYDHKKDNHNNDDDDDDDDDERWYRSSHIMKRIEVLLSWGCQYAVVTHGSRGATVYYYAITIHDTEKDTVSNNSFNSGNNTISSSNSDSSSSNNGSSDSSNNNNSSNDSSSSSSSVSSTAMSNQRSQHSQSIQIIHQPGVSLPADSVVDSTGAGDAFIGAFLVAWNHRHHSQQLTGGDINDSINMNIRNHNHNQDSNHIPIDMDNSKSIVDGLSNSINPNSNPNNIDNSTNPNPNPNNIDNGTNPNTNRSRDFIYLEEVDIKSHIEVILRHACSAGAVAVTLVGGSTVPINEDQYHIQQLVGGSTVPINEDQYHIQQLVGGSNGLNTD